MADINLLKEQTKEFLLDRYGIVGSTQSDNPSHFFRKKISHF